MIVGNPLQMKNLDLLLDLKLDPTDINLSTKLRNIGVVFDENLTLKCQIAAVKKKGIGGLINIAKISKFIHRESKLKLVHCFFSDTNRFMQRLTIWTAKYRFSRYSNDSECCCENHCEFA